MLTLLLTAALAQAPEAELPPDTPVSELPDAVQSVFAEGEAAWERGDLAEAEAKLVTVTEQAPAFSRGWRRRCGAVLAQDRADQALPHCRKAVELDPTFRNRTALAIVLLQTEGGQDE
ncbi:MAG: hypothetical protein KC656_34345, partial [Myxococcales bacterium]|nr:hypothetical protein [Myxococcales bacterium]